MKTWETRIAAAAACLVCLYFALDRYTFRSGVARSTADIKEVLDLADDIYDPLIEGDVLWSFPFPDEVPWRLVRRGSMIDMSGSIAPTAAHEFLRHIDHPDLSGKTYPTESGIFEFIVGEALIRGTINLLSGEFRMEIMPVIPRD